VGGDREHLATLFGDRVALEAPTKEFVFRFESAQQHIDYFSGNYPPIVAALGQLDEESRGRLREDLRELAEQMNVANDGDQLALPLGYLEVVATLRRSPIPEQVADRRRLDAPPGLTVARSMPVWPPRQRSRCAAAP
jgi:hypothetical protein